jgi:bifunctional non-homologous end joining protein LigD
MAALRLTSCTIDGEIAVCDDRELTVFDLLRHGERVKHEAVLFAFDLLELDGEDYSWRPIEMRKRALAQLTANAPSGLQLVEHLLGDGLLIYQPGRED